MSFYLTYTRSIVRCRSIENNGPAEFYVAASGEFRFGFCGIISVGAPPIDPCLVRGKNQWHI